MNFSDSESERTLSQADPAGDGAEEVVAKHPQGVNHREKSRYVTNLRYHNLTLELVTRSSAMTQHIMKIMIGAYREAGLLPATVRVRPWL